MKSNSAFRSLAAAFAAATLSIMAYAATFVKDVMVTDGSAIYESGSASTPPTSRA